MKCARCGHPSEGASWYCANCGAALSDLNVADSGRRRPLPPILRWSLWLAAAALGLVVLAVLVVGLARRGDEAGPLEALRDAQRSATEAAGTGAATAGATEAGPADGEAVTPPTPNAPGGAPGSVTGAATDPSPVVPEGVVVREGAPVWAAGRAEVPPAIDGRLEDWSAPFTLAEPIELSKVVFGTENWDGSDDLSAEALVAWDPAALYLGLRVWDDRFSQPSVGNLIYRGDSIELQLDVQLAEDFQDGSYSEDDWQLGISPGDLAGAGRPPEAWVWRPEADAGAVDFPIAARRLDDGYVLEAAVPWSIFGFDTRARRSLGFALNISDNDLPSPEQLSMISSSPARLWGDPRSFGTLLLEE